MTNENKLTLNERKQKMKIRTGVSDTHTHTHTHTHTKKKKRENNLEWKKCGGLRVLYNILCLLLHVEYNLKNPLHSNIN